MVRPGELIWFGNTPVIWVAEGKNANYPSRAACDSGHWGFDTCDRNERTFRFPVTSSAQNVGSAAHPLGGRPDAPGCVDAAHLVPPRDLPGSECIWTAGAFRGWSGRTHAGATGYARYLRDVAGFIDAGETR